MNKYDFVKLLKNFKKEMNGKKVLLIWDSLPAHRSKIVMAYIASKTLAAGGTLSGICAGTQSGGIHLVADENEGSGTCAAEWPCLSHSHRPQVIPAHPQEQNIIEKLSA